MTGKEAMERIIKITDILKTANDFDEQHAELEEDLWFLSDMVCYLCDYRDVLQNAINNAKLNL